MKCSMHEPFYRLPAPLVAVIVPDAAKLASSAALDAGLPLSIRDVDDVFKWKCLPIAALRLAQQGCHRFWGAWPLRSGSPAGQSSR